MKFYEDQLKYAQEELKNGKITSLGWIMEMVMPTMG
jgi:hypothetical protein